jgi:hypothetical protein
LFASTWVLPSCNPFLSPLLSAFSFIDDWQVFNKINFLGFSLQNLAKIQPQKTKKIVASFRL